MADPGDPMTVVQPRRCKDCPADGPIRPTPHPGPRCSTHHRERRRAVKLATHAKRTEATYGISGEQYWALLEFQGGTCAICRLATGKTKRLAVDHDHNLAMEHDHPVDQACRLCIRGLLCGRCNRWGVPLFVAAILRALEYLTNPPARRFFADA